MSDILPVPWLAVAHPSPKPYRVTSRHDPILQKVIANRFNSAIPFRNA